MAIYVVMEPPSRGGRKDGVLVRDGFHLLAFLVPVIWLLWHRLWIEALAALVVALALARLGSMAGYGPASGLLSLLVAIYVGLEGAALRVAALRRRGWREWGAVEAGNAREAEIRYLAEAFGDAEEIRHEPSQPPQTEPPRRATPPPSGPALGLLSYPGRG